MEDDISHANGLQQISNYISRWFLFGNWQSGSWWKRAIWIDCLNHVANLKHNPFLQQQKLLSTHETKKTLSSIFFLLCIKLHLKSSFYDDMCIGWSFT